MRRRRKPEAANQTTWSVIAGSVVLVVLFLGAARAGNGLAGALVVVALVAYAGVLAFVAHINIVQVLWGDTIDEQDPYVREELVVPLTLAIAVSALATYGWTLASGEAWGWFAPLAALIAAGYLIALLILRRSPGPNTDQPPHQSEHDT